MEALRNRQHECLRVLSNGRVTGSRWEQKKQQLANLEKEKVDLESAERETKKKCAVFELIFPTYSHTADFIF